MATKKNTTVTKDGKTYEYYRITRTIGHEMKNGKKVPIKKQFIGTSKTNAEKKYEEWKEAQRSQKETVDTVKTMAEEMEHYANNVLKVNSKYAQSTRELYIDAYKKHLKGSDVFEKTITNVTSEDIQILYNGLDTGATAMATVNKFMKGFVKWAMLNKYCTDILSIVVIPEKKANKQSEEIVVWTEDELKLILSQSSGFAHKLIVTAVYSGLRISELLGLKYENIYDDVIHVRKQFYRGVWQDPKANSVRDIPLHPKIKEAIGEGKGLIFCTSIGTPLDYHNVMKRVDRVYDDVKIKHKKFHAYRATFCTELCKAKVPLQVASKLMGHKSVEVTAKFYALVEIEEKTEAIMKLNF